MDTLYLRIIQNESKYGLYLLERSKILKCNTRIGEFDRHSSSTSTVKTSRKIVRLYFDGILLHYVLKEFAYCPGYRNRFIDRIFNESGETNVVLVINLIPAAKEIIDHNWNYRISHLVRERCELEHALSWLSTLGGAFSALGDYFSNFAKVAGKISYHQLLLAVRMGDPSIISRCKLYFSLSLIQQHDFKQARQIIESEYAAAKDSVVVDTRLLKMCLGIWSKLRYEHRIFKQMRKCTRLKLR